jgi:ADP-heptose:LPS heptosyltransferase
MGFTTLARLLKLTGVRFFSLQKDAKPHASLAITDWTAELADFAETAGLIENLDLVISVDTSVAHLAGAMGKRVWVMLPFAPDWRWLREREDSPWYPTMRLFRQARRGDWDEVFRRIAAELERLASAL